MPVGHAEELALEQHAVRELEHEAASHWAAGRYANAQACRVELEAARARVKELEQEQA